MTIATRETQRCVAIGCLAVGTPHEGYCFFLCQRCMERCLAILERPRRRAAKNDAGKLFERGMKIIAGETL